MITTKSKTIERMPTNLQNLYELAYVKILEAAKVDAVGRIALIQDNPEYIRLGILGHYGEEAYQLYLYDHNKSFLLRTSSIQKYMVSRRESGEWILTFVTRSGSIYNLNLGTEIVVESF